MMDLLEYAAQMVPPVRETDLRWLQVLSHLDPKYGGISTVVPMLATPLVAEGVSGNIEAFCAVGEHHSPEAVQGNVRFWPIERQRWFRNAELYREFGEEVRDADGLHLHGLWDATSAVAAKAARQHRKPYVLSAHGMLEPWALQQGRWKKRVYSALVERDIVCGARCLHALTPAEAVQYRDYTGKRIPTVVIPNGVTLPGAISPEPFFDKFPRLRDRRIVLFLARLHKKKGIDLLVDVWPRISQRYPEAALVVAGPESGDVRAQLEAHIAASRCAESVVFTGMLDPKTKWSALAAAECMVLPSHSEGLSMSVLEALVAAVPVLITPQCNMPWVAQAGAGWLTEANKVDLADSLMEVLAQDQLANAAIGRAGQAHVTKNFSWSAIAERMAEAYRWCLGGPVPTQSEVVQ